MMIRQSFLLFVLIFCCSAHGQMHQKLDSLSKDLANVRALLLQPLTDKSINSISNQLAQAKAKIILLENQLAMSSEKSNPFLPGFIDDLKKNIESLESSFNIQKRALAPMTAAPLIIKDRALQLWDSWQQNKVNSMNYFASFKALPDNNPLTTGKEVAQQQEHQKKIAWLRSALQATEYTLKNAQNRLFDLTQNYQQDYEALFNSIIATANSTPVLPARSVRSLQTEQAPMPHSKILESTPPKDEESFWESDISLELIKQKTIEAKEYAEKHLSSITQQLKKHFTPEEPLQQDESSETATPKTTNPSQKIVTLEPSEKIKKIVHMLYNSRKQCDTLIDINTQLQEILYCMEFLELNKMFSETDPFMVDNVKEIARLMGHTLSSNITDIINKLNRLLARNKTEGSLYKAMVGLPTTLYTIILTKKLSWISSQTKHDYEQNKKLFHQIVQQSLFPSTLLSTQEQKECITYTNNFLKRQSSNTVEDIVAAYVLLQSVAIITTPYQKDLLASQEIVSFYALKIITETKNNLFAFLQNDVLKALKSPFPVERKLLNNVFVQLNSLRTLEPLIMLVKQTQNNTSALCIQKDYEQINQTLQLMYDTFSMCTATAKKRSEAEKNLTAVKLLHDILERALTLIKPFTY